MTIINEDIDHRKWCKFQNTRFPVLPSREYMFTGRFDKAVATMWSTVKFLDLYTNIGQRYYLVQNYETNFMNLIIHLELKQISSIHRLQMCIF